jgi:hypothetical protein
MVDFLHLDAIKVLISAVIMLQLTLPAIILVAVVLIVHLQHFVLIVVRVEARFVRVEVIRLPDLLIVMNLDVCLFLLCGPRNIHVLDNLWWLVLVFVEVAVYLLPFCDLLVLICPILGYDRVLTNNLLQIVL